MPSWPIHRKHVRLARLKVDVCLDVDVLVDRGELRGADGEVVNLHDFSPSAPKTLAKAVVAVYESHGADGVKCVLLHYVLDYVEYAVRAQREANMIVKVVESTINSVKEESFPHELRAHVEASASHVIDYLKRNIDLILSDVTKSIRCEEEVANQLRELINIVCWHELFSRHVLGRGITVNFRALQMLNVKAHENFRRKLGQVCEEIDLDGFIQELRVLMARVKSIPKLGYGFLKALDGEARGMDNIARVIKALRKAVKEEADRMFGERRGLINTPGTPNGFPNV